MDLSWSLPMYISMLPLSLLLFAHRASETKASRCEALTSLHLPEATITAARTVSPRSGPVSDLPEFCQVAATLKPSPDSDIKMEIWLPTAGWNGKMEAQGNGGWSGSINPASLATGLRRGYATTMSDLGHEGSRAEFALGHPEKLIDYGYRTAHVMTIAAKAIINSYYGQAPKFSYWNGCSAGGRSALMEAQRFPADYDGIVAGAPGLNWTGRAIRSIQVAQTAHRSDSSYIPPAKYAFVHDAVLKACDAKDGVTDGVLEDPTRCSFDPGQLRCEAGDKPDCLTGPQIETAQTMYAPLLDEHTNTEVFPGFERGSELNWGTMGGPQPFTIGLDYFKYIVFRDAGWDYRTFSLKTDLARAQRAGVSLLNATDPNLKPFQERGGKLIQYHGWNDAQIAPGVSPAYYKSVLTALGSGGNVESFYRLFMVPGMGHCTGGEGTSTFDMLTALERWVEQGVAPDRIESSRLQNGKIDRTRPLCPYPQQAEYKGSGSPDEATNFTCRVR
jgi:feruloyl esterase